MCIRSMCMCEKILDNATPFAQRNLIKKKRKEAVYREQNEAAPELNEIRSVNWGCGCHTIPGVRKYFETKSPLNSGSDFSANTTVKQ